VVSAAPRRIGLLGGSFNPPHLAHLALARLAQAELQLDELRWLPAGRPWQKDAASLASAEQRLTMVRLLVGETPGMVVDERELRRPGASYTIDTVRELRAEFPGATLLLILGQDQYQKLDTWRDAAQLRSLVTFAVAARDGQTPQAPPTWAGLAHEMIVLPLPRFDLSATLIRQHLAAGLSVSPLVGEAVARYIDHTHLYRAAPGL
jgi:nicotinate-nucleotide adenylyltransferase